MSAERIYLFDTTLRDGAQTPGIDFSLEDKVQIIALLERLGIDYVEGGYPGANPLDTALFSKKRAKSAKLTAFGMTKRAGRSVENDPGLAAVLEAEADAVCLVAKSWDFHVRVALGTTNEENLKSISQSVEAIVAKGREAMIDCEHFFDGYKANPDYAIACAKAAYDAGARWVVLCDTNGGTLPEEVKQIVTAVCQHVPGTHVGIHTHNDTGNAVAGSLAAVDAGARQIQGTLNGLGERCGNANLTSLIPTLLLKEPYASQYETGIDPGHLKGMVKISRLLDDVLNRVPRRQAPYVGASAFAHKAGLHASAILKDPGTYEHIDPALVGIGGIAHSGNGEQELEARSLLRAECAAFGIGTFANVVICRIKPVFARIRQIAEQAPRHGIGFHTGRHPEVFRVGGVVIGNSLGDTGLGFKAQVFKRLRRQPGLAVYTACAEGINPAVARRAIAEFGLVADLRSGTAVNGLDGICGFPGTVSRSGCRYSVSDRIERGDHACKLERGKTLGLVAVVAGTGNLLDRRGYALLLRLDLLSLVPVPVEKFDERPSAVLPDLCIGKPLFEQIAPFGMGGRRIHCRQHGCRKCQRQHSAQNSGASNLRFHKELPLFNMAASKDTTRETD